MNFVELVKYLLRIASTPSRSWMLRKIQARREVQSLSPRNSGTRVWVPDLKQLSVLKPLGVAFNLAAQGNHLGSPMKYRPLGPNVTILDTWSGVGEGGLGIQSFADFPDLSNM